MNCLIVGEKLIMMENSKIKTIVDGILIPYAIYFLVTFVVTGVYVFVTNNKNPNAVMIQGIANVFVFISLLPFYLRFIKRYNIGTKKLNFKVLFYLIPLAFSVCLIGNILISYIPITTENIVSTEVFKIVEEYNIYISLLIVSILVPLVEELLFRGFFYDTVKLLSNDVVAIIFTSIAFAVAHFNWQQGLYALFAGIFLGFVKCRHKKLIYPIVMHLLMNLASIVLVPTILTTCDFKQQLFALFISFCLLNASIYRLGFSDL